METSLTWLGRMVATPNGADWQQLAHIYPPLLHAWLHRAGVPASDRDDLVQEVLVVVVRQVKEFDHRGRGAFRAWLRGILANHIRKYFRDRDVPVAFDLEQFGRLDTTISQQWDRDHDAFLVSKAMAASEGDFAPATWRAFRMSTLDGQSAANVASALGLSVNSVLLARSRVLKRLRAELAGLVE